MDDGNSTTTRLLTLLNISGTKAGKRKRNYSDDAPATKLNKRQSLRFADTNMAHPDSDEARRQGSNEAAAAPESSDDRAEDNETDGMNAIPIRLPLPLIAPKRRGKHL